MFKFFKFSHFLKWICLAWLSTTAVGLRGNAINGTLDLSQKAFGEETEVPLGGYWEVYPMQLLEPGASEFYQEDKKYQPFTRLWGHRDFPMEGSQGFATYRLQIYLPDSLPSLALRIPEFYTAYRLFANGYEVAANGRVDTSLKGTQPHWDPKTRIVDLHPGKNELVLQIANFHHAKGGAAEQIILASTQEASYLDNLQNSSYLFIFGAFLIAAIFSLTIFFFHRNDLAFLFFSLFSFTYLYRLIGADTYILHDLLQWMPWSVSVRLEYLFLYLSIATFSYYLWHIMRQRFSIWFIHGLAGVSGIMTLMLALPATIFTAALPYYLILAGIAYLATMIYILSKHTIRTPEAIAQITSLAAIGIVLIFRVSGYFQVTGPLLWLSFVSYAIFIVASTIGLAWRFGKNFLASTEAGEAAAKTQQDFLNTMSHELRTPMNAILGMTEFLMEADLKPREREKVETIKSNGESLNNIMLDVLSFSEMGSGEIRLEKQLMSIHDCVDVAIELTQKYLKGKSIDFETDISNAIPEQLVGDPARVKQIFVHLLSNAFKFTEKGSVKLQGLLLEQEEENVKVKFRLEDTGIGIKKGKLNGIFDAFSQIESGNTRQFGGAGLGLTITRQLVQLMDGELLIESTVGKGTTVDMTLVFRKPRDNGKGSLRQALTQNEELNTSLRILYAEDNPINQKLLTMMLKSMGIDIDVVENGRLAWNSALQKHYDIILMDIQMPEMDGIEATRNIVRDVAQRPIIIAVTANAGAADKRKAIGAGMNDFIAKPIKADLLKKTLIKWQGIHDYLHDDAYTGSPTGY